MMGEMKPSDAELIEEARAHVERGTGTFYQRNVIRDLLALIARTPPTTQGGEGESLPDKATPGHPDAYLNALLDYTRGFYFAAIEAGLKPAHAADAVQHVERAARGLHALAAAPPAPASDHVGEGLHHHGRHPWAQTGDQPDRVWMLRFSDQDVGDMIWTGEGAEQEARAAYAKHQGNWTCYLLATVEAAPSPDHAALVGEAKKLLGRAYEFTASSPDSWDTARSVQPLVEELADLASRLAAALHPSAEGGADKT